MLRSGLGATSRSGRGRCTSLGELLSRNISCFLIDILLYLVIMDGLATDEIRSARSMSCMIWNLPNDVLSYFLAFAMRGV